MLFKISDLFNLTTPPHPSPLLVPCNQFLLQAMAEPAPTYRWYFNGQLIRQGSGLSPNGNALEFEIIREEHSGMYQCEAFNKYVNSFTTAQVIVDGQLASPFDVC